MSILVSNALLLLYRPYRRSLLSFSVCAYLIVLGGLVSAGEDDEEDEDEEGEGEAHEGGGEEGEDVYALSMEDYGAMIEADRKFEEEQERLRREQEQRVQEQYERLQQQVRQQQMREKQRKEEAQAAAMAADTPDDLHVDVDVVASTSLESAIGGSIIRRASPAHLLSLSPMSRLEERKRELAEEDLKKREKKKRNSSSALFSRLKVDS